MNKYLRVALALICIAMYAIASDDDFYDRYEGGKVWTASR